jgi:tetratricopeptide (TPR) repeat protein/tRNA A-37 threonylcarbamoyl transferase component Bud32
VSHPPPNEPLIGRTFSQYEIVSKLGGGGMGVVYKARDTKLGRSVALKFLPPQWSHDENAKQRFMREAQAASATNHRNICIIHNIEETDDGRLFIVMAYYEGETLKQRLERGPLPVLEAIEIASEIAEGLAKAHAQGVVHRDVKPGNLIVTDDGVKILDFGLAKFADALQLTVPGSTIGTLAYMSPEQARGEEADAKSDVWALGIVMYEMLTGSVPFHGAYPEATFHAIKHEPLPSLRAVRPDVPEALERIVMKALEKDASRRFQSAREPARDLRLLQGRTIPLELSTQAVQVVAGRRLGELRPRRRRRLRPLMWAAAAGVALIAAGGAWYWWLRGPVDRIRVAIVPVANHTGVPDLDRYSLSLTQSLIDEISESPNVRVVPYLRLVEIIRPFLASEGHASGSDAIQAIAAESDVPFLVVPTLVYRDRDATWLVQTQIRNARTGTSVASYDTAPVTSSLSQQTAFRLIASAAEVIQQHFKANGPGRSFTPRAVSSRFHSPDAARAFEQGQNAYDELEYAAALDAFTESASLDSQHAATYAWLSRVLLISNRKNESVAAAQRAKSLVAPDASRSEKAFVNAVLAESEGDSPASEQAYRDLVAIEPDDPRARVELADYLKRRQDSNQSAVEAYHDALTLDATYIRPHVDLCQLYTRIDDHPMAEKEAQLAIARFRLRGLKGGEAQALLCLGEAQREQGGSHLAEARGNVEAARALIEPLGQPYNMSRVVFYQGNVEYSDGRLVDAGRFFEDAADRTHAVGNGVTEGLALMNLGVVNVLLGKPTPGEDFFRRSREVFLRLGDERRVAELDVDTAGLQNDYGGDPSQVLKTLANAKTNLERLGHVDFQLVAIQSEADGHRYAGRIERAQTLLRSALQAARDKQLTSKASALRLALARTDIQANSYEAARTALEEMVDRETGPGDEDLRIQMGTVLTRVGDFAAAKNHLERARADVESRQLVGLRPAVEVALGGLAYQMREPALARSHFDRAIKAWTDPLPNAFVVEARCFRGLETAMSGRPAEGRRDLEGALDDSRKMGRTSLEALCRVHLARVDVSDRKYQEAILVLKDVPDDTNERTIGPELRASVEYWRGRALAAGNDPDARAHLERARALLLQLQGSLPETLRARFTARPDIGEMLRASDF